MKRQMVQVLLIGALASTLAADAVAPLGAEYELTSNDEKQKTDEDNLDSIDSDEISIIKNEDVVVGNPYYEITNGATVNVTEVPSEVIETDNVEEVTEEVEETFDYIGYASTAVNVRALPNTESEVLKVMSFNEEIHYAPIQDDWVKIKLDDDTYGYIYTDYISYEKSSYESKNAPMTSGMKSWMSFKSLTSRNSKQYKLQQMCVTGDYGIRMYNGRYCVALGSYYTTTIGQYFDLVLENGTVIPCILGDAKDNKHTDSNNQITSHNGCMSEFIVDVSALNNNAKRHGNISYCKDDWKSRVVEVRIYDEYVSL